MIRVLVVDDSALVRKLLGRVLSEDPDFEVATARDGEEALEKNSVFKPDVITLDVQMPQMNGIECLDQIMLQRPCPVLMVSSLTAEGADATLEALRLGAIDFVTKPSGAVSLRMAEFAPLFKQKVRSAAAVRLPASHRLQERLRFRNRGLRPAQSRTETLDAPVATDDIRQGDGLVLVGTSTGGPPALEALLGGLQADFPWPVVVAQHMPSSFTGPLARRLNGLCALEVSEVVQPMVLRPGAVYIGRGDADVVVSRRGKDLVALSVPSRADYPWHPSTDRLVRSAMEHVEPRQLIGVLMTGMGDDGAAAMAQLKADGGRTIAEAEETAVVWGMPGSLVRIGGASWVVPLPRISNRLNLLLPAHAARP